MEGEGEFETIINQLDPAQDRLRLMELEDNEQRQSEARQQQLALLEATLQDVDSQAAEVKESYSQTLLHHQQTHQPTHSQLQADLTAQATALSATLAHTTLAIKNQQSALEALMSEMAQLQHDEQTNVEPQNDLVLKLGLASKLGIDLIEDLQRPGFYNKALVCSTQRSELHTVGLDDPQFSTFYYANLLWDMCS